MRAPHAAVSERLRRYFRNEKSAALIGRHYIATVGDVPDQHVLVTHIMGSRATAEQVLALSEDVFSSTIRSWIREDFKMSRTVSVDAWVLSRTEVKIFALIAMTETNWSA